MVSKGRGQLFQEQEYTEAEGMAALLEFSGVELWDSFVRV
jgi:hypothetical protein